MTAALNEYAKFLAGVGRLRIAAPSAVCIFSLEVADFSRVQARLGYTACVTLMQRLCDALGDDLGARERVVAVGASHIAAVASKVLNEGHALLAAERLARTAEAIFDRVNLAIKPRVLIGIAVDTDPGLSSERLLQRAQLAAEAARSRRARVVLYDGRRDREILAAWSLGDGFARALEEGALSVHYQPKIDLHHGIPSGAEALMRWEEASKPVASPDVFIPLAEEAGLMHQLTWYALSNALRASRAAGIPMAVNISAETLHHHDFLNMMRTAIATWNTGVHTPTIEITEGALVEDFDEARERLNALRKLGVRVSIDDFGTGYSSLRYFKKIPADELKIDKSFVRGIVHDADDLRLVNTIIQLARHFQMSVVAEGVEDWDTFDALETLGCDYVQGFLISRAVDLPHLITWLGQYSRDRPADRPNAATRLP